MFLPHLIFRIEEAFLTILFWRASSGVSTHVLLAGIRFHAHSQPIIGKENGLKLIH